MVIFLLIREFAPFTSRRQARIRVDLVLSGSGSQYSPRWIPCYCSPLSRIHDFLDRFGLINTRTGGKRPPSFPVPPPSVHMWNPMPALERPSRATKSNIVGTGTRGRAQEPDRLVATTGVTGGQVIGSRGCDAAQAQQQQLGCGRSETVGREWHRKELVKLVEAAVATPDHWETVAFQVR